MAARTVTSTRTTATANTSNRRNSAASFFGTAGARTRGCNSVRRQLPRPLINANAVASEVVDCGLVSNGVNEDAFHSSDEMTADVPLQTELNTSADSTTDDSQPQFRSVVNDATSIDNIR